MTGGYRREAPAVGTLTRDKLALEVQLTSCLGKIWYGMPTIQLAYSVSTRCKLPSDTGQLRFTDVPGLSF